MCIFSYRYIMPGICTMKVTLAVIAFFAAFVCFANMASPVLWGSNNVAPVTSRNIDITKELLVITPAKDFEKATFSIDYFIHTDTTGLQVPLLFVAAGYRDSMTITIDGIPVQSQNLMVAHKLDQGKLNLSFHDFDNQFDTIGGRQNIKITWNNGSARYYDVAELQYFEANITKGPHTIHVDYNAQIEINRSGWIRSYKCNYFLSPAKHWKTFGGLDVMIDKRNFTKPLNTNLGKPAEHTGAVTKWHFNSIPADVLEISYTPTVTGFAALLISISPLGLATIAGIMLLATHILLMVKYRQKKSIYKLVYYTGMFSVPLFIFICYGYSFDLIDAVIGSDASRYHGYYFLAFIFYFLLAPVYATIIYMAGNIIKPKSGLTPNTTG